VRLQKFGINNLQELDNIIPKDFIERYLTHTELDIVSDDNFAGLLRDIMILTDPTKYFENCWQKRWQGTHIHTFDFIKSYQPKIDSIFNKYGIEISWRPTFDIIKVRKLYVNRFVIL
jgi:hypothetical protein